jgi:hypothetical protein
MQFADATLSGGQSSSRLPPPFALIVLSRCRVVLLRAGGWGLVTNGCQGCKFGDVFIEYNSESQ